MSAVTMNSGWPAAGGPLTVADLERTPDDGRRYELVDGVLIVSPAPLIPHQVVLLELSVLLDASLPDDLAAVPGVGVRMSDITELVPDLFVGHRRFLVGETVTLPLYPLAVHDAVVDGLRTMIHEAA